MDTRVFPDSAKPTVKGFSQIVCCTSATNRWRRFAEELNDKPRDWYFYSDRPRNFFERLLQPLSISTIRASWQAIQTVKRQRANLLITDVPRLSFWCAAIAALQGVKVEHIAASFYLPKLPHGLRNLVAQWAYSKINCFTVHSKIERQLYGEHFGIPFSRFEMQYPEAISWDVRSSEFVPGGDYICALSTQAVDYRTLMLAMAKLPHISLVLNVKRGQWIAANVPPNVRIYVELPPARVAEILQHSRFTVFAMQRSQLPCDHAAFVTTMQSGKTFVATNLSSISDYAFHNSNAVLCEPSNPDALASAIQDLWQNVLKAEVLGENGKEFVATFCSHQATQKYFCKLLIGRGG